MTPGNRLTGFYHWTTDYELRGASKYVPRESMLEKAGPVWMTKGEWQTVRGNTLVASMQYGRWDYTNTYDGMAPGKQSTTDIATLYMTGNLFTQAANTNGRRGDQGRNHTKGVVSWYKPDLLGGNHEFKAGLDHLWTWFNDGFLVPPAGAAYQLRFNNGVPFQLATTNAPLKTANHANYLGVYGQDSWTLARRLTLNLGIRVERESTMAPPQCREAAPFAAAECWEQIQLVTFNSLAPRAHLAFDIMGDGKTVIKGGYGRFNQLRELSPDIIGVNLNTIATTIWDWHDNNGNKLYEPGEVNLNPNGPDFRSIAGTTLGVVNPNEKQPKTDEFSLTFERELFANTSARVTGVYSRNFNAYGLSEINRDGQYTIPITNPDPGPDGRLGTADDTGQAFTYYEYPTSLGSAAFSKTMITNNPAAETNYKTFEIAVMKRPARGWQVGTSYSSTWIDVPISCGASGSGLGSGTPLVWFPTRCLSNPNQALNTANNTREWQAKVSGAYNLPYGIVASANYDIRSGGPQARQVLFTGGRTIRSIALNVEPIGTFRLPNTHELDVRAGKRFNLGGARTVELRFDLYNALNKGTVTTQNLQSGATYLRPATILFPRILQIGATVNF
jgi:outer membrane receptor protein involved in Fe transport